MGIFAAFLLLVFSFALPLQAETKNPEKYISYGLEYKAGSARQSNFFTAPGFSPVRQFGGGRTEDIQFDVRIPVSDIFTFSIGGGQISRERKFDVNDELFGETYTDRENYFKVGVRFYVSEQ